MQLALALSLALTAQAPPSDPPLPDDTLDTAPVDTPPVDAPPVDAPPVDAPPVDTAPVAAPLVEPASAADAPPVDAAPAPADLAVWAQHVKIGGGALLWYYQPLLLDGVEPSLSLFFANVVIDAAFPTFDAGPLGTATVGLHLEPRFRDSRLRPFFDAPVWLQEAYVHATAAATTVKVGKVYSRFGAFWDGSFYGNVQVYDGLKLDPSYGVSIEGDPPALGAFGVRFWAQYFLVDGQSNVSLPGRDTISIVGADRRHQAIARVEPRFVVSDAITVTTGLSGEYLQAALPDDLSHVGRFAVDATAVVGPVKVWGEVTRQQGRSVVDFPAGGKRGAAAEINYAWAGAQLALAPVTLRYSYSVADYHDVGIVEDMHLPGVGVALGDHVSLLAEGVLWQRYADAVATGVVDRSLNVTLFASF